MFETVVVQGMERFCFACRRSKRLKYIVEYVADDNTTEVREVDSETKTKRKHNAQNAWLILDILVLIQRI